MHVNVGIPPRSNFDAHCLRLTKLAKIVAGKSRNFVFANRDIFLNPSPKKFEKCRKLCEHADMQLYKFAVRRQCTLQMCKDFALGLNHTLSLLIAHHYFHAHDMSLYSPFFQAVTLILGEILITALGIGFTSASSTPIRSYGFPLVIASAYVANLLIIHQVSSTLWAGVLAGNASTYVFRYLELVLIDKWSFEDGGPTRLQSSPDEKIRKKIIENNRKTTASLQPATFWRRLRFGLGVTLNPRLVNTAYQVKNVPRWSQGEPQQVPSRGYFLRYTVFIILLNYLIVDSCSLAAQPERNALLFSDEKVALLTRWNSLGPEEIVVRVLASLMLWLNIYCIFRIFHGLIVLLAVGFGLSKVQDWPWPFGPLSEAYSVRQFWGYVNSIRSYSISVGNDLRRL